MNKRIVSSRSALSIFLIAIVAFSLIAVLQPTTVVQSQTRQPQIQPQPNTKYNPPPEDPPYTPVDMLYNWTKANSNGKSNIPSAYSLGYTSGNILANPSFETGEYTGWQSSGGISITKTTGGEPTYVYGQWYSGAYSDTQQANSVYEVAQSAIYYLNQGSQSKYPAYASWDTRIGTRSWSNPSYITGSSDGYYASSAGVAWSATWVYSYYILTEMYTNPFTIPTSATILGIQVQIYRHANVNLGDDSCVADYHLYLSKTGGDPIGSDHALPETTYWSTSNQWVTYGSSSDLWETTWTASEVDASAFGVWFAIGMSDSVGNTPTGYVDCEQITVYYAYAYYRASYYYQFQMTETTPSNILTLTWGAKGKSSSPNIGIYLYNFVTSSWDLKDTWTSTNNDKTDSVDKGTYMASSSPYYMYIRLDCGYIYNPDSQTSSFTVSADYLRWTYTYSTSLTIGTSQVYHGSYSGYLAMSGAYIYQNLTSLSIPVAPNLCFYGAMYAGASLAWSNRIDVTLKLTNGTNTVYMGYVISSSTPNNSSNYYWFQIGSAASQWYYATRNVTADFLCKLPTYISFINKWNVTQITLDDLSGGSSAMYWDSLMLFKETTMFAGSWSQGDLETPVGLGTAPNNYPYGWSGGAGTAGDIIWHQTYGGIERIYLHYSAVYNYATNINNGFKSFWYTLGTNPPQYVSFALWDAGSAVANVVNSIEIADTTANKVLYYEFSDDAAAVRGENINRQVIHEQISLQTWYFRIKNWQQDWAAPAQFGVAPTMGDTWRISINATNINAGANWPAMFWDAIWMGNTLRPQYNAYMFSDVMNGAWANNFNGLAIGHTRFGFDYNGYFTNTAGTSGGQISQFDFQVPLQNYNYRMMSIEVSDFNIVSYSGTNCRSSVYYQNITATQWGYVGSPQYINIFKDGEALYGNRSIITWSIPYSSADWERFFVYDTTDSGTINCRLALGWMTVQCKDTVPPSQVSLNSPNDGYVNAGSSINLTWNPATDTGAGSASGIQYYELQVSKGVVDFSSNVTTYGVFATYKYLTGLTQGMYYWRVCAVDMANNYGAYSVARRFQIYTGPAKYSGPCYVVFVNQNDPNLNALNSLNFRTKYYVPSVGYWQWLSPYVPVVNVAVGDTAVNFTSYDGLGTVVINNQAYTVNQTIQIPVNVFTVAVQSYGENLFGTASLHRNSTTSGGAQPMLGKGYTVTYYLYPGLYRLDVHWYFIMTGSGNNTQIIPLDFWLNRTYWINSTGYPEYCAAFLVPCSNAKDIIDVLSLEGSTLTAIRAQLSSGGTVYDTVIGTSSAVAELEKATTNTNSMITSAWTVVGMITALMPGGVVAGKIINWIWPPIDEQTKKKADAMKMAQKMVNDILSGKTGPIVTSDSTGRNFHVGSYPVEPRKLRR